MLTVNVVVNKMHSRTKNVTFLFYNSKIYILLFSAFFRFRMEEIPINIMMQTERFDRFGLNAISEPEKLAKEKHYHSFIIS